MRYFCLAMLIGLGALAGCQRQTPAAQSAAQSAAGCAADAASQWPIAAGQIHQISAVSAGPDCAKAVVTLVVRGPDGVPLFAGAWPTGAGNLTFLDVKDSAEMRARLQDWVEPAQAGLTSSADLPPWPEGAEGPKAKPIEGLTGEFPFLPDGEAYGTREAYEALRAANSPVFCYVQGMESYACLTAQDGAVFPIGLQVFPG